MNARLGPIGIVVRELPRTVVPLSTDALLAGDRAQETTGSATRRHHAVAAEWMDCMESRKIGVAIIGCGAIGQTHAAVASGLDVVEVVAVVDAVEASAERLATTMSNSGLTRPRVHASLTDALGNPEVDLVVITTPSGLHVEQAVAALSARRHVVIEKPLDVDLVRARVFADEARRAADEGLVSSVISQHRFDTASEIVHEAALHRRFGTIATAIASTSWWRSQTYYDSADWRGTWQFDGGGALMNQGIHSVDLLLSFLGRPVEVSGHIARLAHERIEVEDSAAATITFESGATAVLHATTGAYPGLSTRLQLMGSLGSAVIEDDELTYFHTATSHKRDIGPMGLTLSEGNQAPAVLGAVEERGFRLGMPLPPAPAGQYSLDPASHHRQYRDVIAAIERGGRPRVTVEHAFHALALIRSVYLSSSLGRPVLFDEVVAGQHDHVRVHAVEVS